MTRGKPQCFDEQERYAYLDQRAYADQIIDGDALLKQAMDGEGSL